MLDANTPITLTLPAGACDVLLQLLNKAPYEVAAPIITSLRQQIVAVDPTAFDPPPLAAPRVNGVDARE